MTGDGFGEDRRDFLKCMAWAGTGALFAVSGGVPTSVSIDAATAMPMRNLAESDYLLGVADETRLGALRFRLVGEDELQIHRWFASPPEWR